MIASRHRGGETFVLRNYSTIANYIYPLTSRVPFGSESDFDFAQGFTCHKPVVVLLFWPVSQRLSQDGSGTVIALGLSWHCNHSRLARDADRNLTETYEDALVDARVI